MLGTRDGYLGTRLFLIPGTRWLNFSDSRNPIFNSRDPIRVPKTPEKNCVSNKNIFSILTPLRPGKSLIDDFFPFLKWFFSEHKVVEEALPERPPPAPMFILLNLSSILPICSVRLRVMAMEPVHRTWISVADKRFCLLERAKTKQQYSWKAWHVLATHCVLGGSRLPDLFIEVKLKLSQVNL